MNFTRPTIDVADVWAMAWVEDSLIDVAGGWRGLTQAEVADACFVGRDMIILTANRTAPAGSPLG